MASDFDPMMMMDSAVEMARSLGGVRAALINEGFTGQQAGDIVVTSLVQNAADTWLRVRGLAGETESKG